jgi:hypothetical protein
VLDSQAIAQRSTSELDKYVRVQAKKSAGLAGILE